MSTPLNLSAKEQISLGLAKKSRIGVVAVGLLRLRTTVHSGPTSGREVIRVKTLLSRHVTALISSKWMS